jgi:peptide/nickel transport system substrate-binding protein
MQLRRLKVRFNKDWRKRQKQVESFGQQAETMVERNFFRRFDRLAKVRRFVLTWMLLVLLLVGSVVAETRSLGGYYQTLQPAPGGIYTEGMVGSYTNANPLYATAEVDQTISRLIFAGLLTYDSKNQLVGDLADSWQSENNGMQYLVHLRPNLTWQDGQPLTASDVAFTIHVIQSPDAESPLSSSWQGVNVTVVNPQTVMFTLPNPLASFPYSLTTGIIPEHILKNVPMDEMRSVSFNTTQPIGAGPFAMKQIQVTGDTPQTQEEQVALRPFGKYWAGTPKLDQFVVHSFGDTQHMEGSFNKGNIDAMVGLDSLPANLSHNSSVQSYQMPITAANYVFFNTSEGVLADSKVRQALVQDSNVTSIIDQLGYPTMPVDEPLLRGQLGYNPQYRQASYNMTAAAATLTADGWLPGNNGLRHKNGQALTFDMFAQNTPEFTQVANTLSQAWHKLGVDVNVYTQSQTDLQPTIESHSYDALLYGISIGVDPDVYAYWDSSQADVRAAARLNFSSYASPTADAALEAGRTRLDPALRVIKYQPFLQAWQQDAPALGLYQPRFLYVTRGSVYGLSEHMINTDTDRFENVQNWEIRQVPTTIK